jgi:putative transposase
MIATVAELAPRLGVAPTCTALEVPRASYYRSLPPRPAPPGRPAPARALPAEERQAVLDVQHEARFAALAPAEVYATLLDEGRYLCSPHDVYYGLAERRSVTSAHGSSRRRSRGIRSGSRTGGRHRGHCRPRPGSSATGPPPRG